MHAMLLMIIVSVMLTIVPLYFLELMLVIMGAELRINVILDLILIYWAGLGIAEAAWGYVISLFLVSAVQIYWLLIKKDA